jgi:hypothetical protein
MAFDNETLKRDVIAFLDTGQLPERPANPVFPLLPDSWSAKIRRVAQMVRNIEDGSAAGITEIFTRDPHVNMACDIYRERQAKNSMPNGAEKVPPPVSGGPGVS